jgi:transcription initiation factor TFIIIB Brf1 subunit/transcription initiation factor TFIIB
VCAQCGLVVVESAVDTGPEWRVFDEREKRRVRTAPLKLVVKTDMAVKPEHGRGGAGWRNSTERRYTATRGGCLQSEARLGA